MVTGRLKSDVNVGGPDGPLPGAPAMTLATLTVANDGNESREWLWAQLDEVRKRYEERYANPAWTIEPLQTGDWVVTRGGVIACKCTDRAYAVLIARHLNGETCQDRAGR